MSGLKLGDLILDPRRVVYIESLRAVVCSGLCDALGVGDASVLHGVVDRMDRVLQQFQPETLVMLGGLNDEEAVRAVARFWGDRHRIHLICNEASSELGSLAEALGCEVHRELVWGRYRFLEVEKAESLELKLLTLAGAPHYVVRVGGVKGMKLAVFLKGVGRLWLPSLNPECQGVSLFPRRIKDLDRYDAFAVGHQRVLPMGKVRALKAFRGVIGALPIAKTTFEGYSSHSVEKE